MLTNVPPERRTLVPDSSPGGFRQAALLYKIVQTSTTFAACDASAVLRNQQLTCFQHHGVVRIPPPPPEFRV
jgi:hypothetical protein